MRGATLVVGPAGTGKTTSLVRRNIELIEAGESGIVFLVQSRRAARALQDRIIREHGRSTGDVRVATWHSFALSMLRLHYSDLDYEREPGLLTAPEQFALVRDMLGAPEEQAEWGDFTRQIGLRGFAEELREFVLRAQDAMESPEQLAERARLARRPDLASAARFFRRYLTAIDDKNVVDASNAITLAIALMDKPEVAEQVRATTRHLLVDDYQNATRAQEQLLRALFSDGGSVTVAADPDSAVFGFRGGAPDVLDRFRKDFAPVTEVEATERHRGTPTVKAWTFDHLTEEAEAIAREARRLHTRESVGWGDIAVVVRRYGSAARTIRRAFERADVPYLVVGENRPLVGEPALRPMIDLVRAALRPAEMEDWLPGLLGSPVVGLDPYDVRALRRRARVDDVPLSTLLLGPPSDMPERIRDALARLRELIDHVRDLDAKRSRPDEIFFQLWERLPMFRDMVERGDHTSLDAVSAFGRAVERFTDRRGEDATFEGFLEALDGADFGPEPWNQPVERHPNAVRIMTAHHSVGAEFEVVFVAGCVEGEFPDARSRRMMLDLRDLLEATGPFDRLQARLAEEKRLFGVATSRARGTQILTAARESSTSGSLTPSALVTAAGLEWQVPTTAIDAMTRREAEAAARKILLDASSEEAARAEAMDLLTRLPGVDPNDWWYEHDWTDPGTPMIGEELKTSFSRLSVMDNCGLQYLYQVELGLDPQTSHYMLVGTWIHDIVDKAASGEIELTEEALFAALDERWDPTIFDGPAIERRRKRDCHDMLRGWLACDGDMKVLETEIAFKFPVEGALVRGRIDALVRLGQSMVRVIDYKTARWAKRESELEDDLQLAIYNLAMRRDPDLAKYGEPKRLELAYLGTVWKNGFKRPGLDPTKRENYEQETQETIEAYVRRIRAEDFAPNPEAECRYCSFKSLCPVWPQGDEAKL